MMFDRAKIVGVVVAAGAALAAVMPMTGGLAGERGNFQQTWEASRPDLDLKRSPSAGQGQKDGATAAEDDTEKPVVPKRQRGSSGSPDRVQGADRAQSQRAVCRAQCNLERMACDQGRNANLAPGQPGFTNRQDQIQAAQQSCYLAVQSCLSRC